MSIEEQLTQLITIERPILQQTLMIVENRYRQILYEDLDIESNSEWFDYSAKELKKAKKVYDEIKKALNNKE